MRVLLLSTYPPRVCGLATFSSDLRETLLQAPGIDAVDVVAVDDGQRAYGPEVVATVAPDDPAAYRAAARLCEDGGYDAVCVQHEFGIFGGAAGRHVLEFLDGLTVPAVTTVHTVLGDPPADLRAALVDVAAASARIIALSPAAVPLLAGHGVDPARVAVIPHGVPPVPFEDPSRHKAAVGLDGHTVLLTFGLLSRNKGIELVLDAMPKLIATHPDVRYVVLGSTHPEVRRHEGEAYRRSLEERVRRLGLTDHVEFRDRYVSLDELRDHLLACDVYVTPYQSREQISSGTLSYAVGMGRAVVSTPYRHAEELLADGRGLLVPFGSSEKLGEALLRLVGDDELREATRLRAYDYGRTMTWPHVGERTALLLQEVVTEADQGLSLRGRQAEGLLEQVEGGDACTRLIRLDHLQALTDDTGVFQHAAYGVPDRRRGYTTDDQTRALLAVVALHRHFGDEGSRRLAATYLSYLQLAQRPDGRFRNAMDYSRRWLDDLGTEDTHGQAVWALAEATRRAPGAGMRELAGELLAAAMPAAAELTHVRAVAYALCGLSELPGDTQAAAVATALGDRLVEAFDRFSQPGWRWCGDELTYANNKMPEALLRAGKAFERPAWTQLGLEALDFVLDATFQGNRFDPVGNERWRTRGGAASVFAQQPIEAGYTAQACRFALSVTGDARYARLAAEAVAWLLGRNRLGIPLYDPATGVCRDGLHRDGISRNAGAESVVCALLGLLAMAEPLSARGSVPRARLAS